MDKFGLRDLPRILFKDNAGSIFLAQNQEVSKQKKHIDLKYHFIREFIEKRKRVCSGVVKKIETEKNTADIGTINLEVHLLKQHEKEIESGMMNLIKIIYGKNRVLCDMLSSGLLDDKM